MIFWEREAKNIITLIQVENTKISKCNNLMCHIFVDAVCISVVGDI
jgi:hypothetical protein